MKRLFLSGGIAIALLLGGCALFNAANVATTEVPVTKAEAQKVLADIQIGHAAVVRTQIAYLDQKPCGLAGSPAPPFCASLKISRQMTAYDRTFTTAMTSAQHDVDTLGDNPTVLALAVKTVRLAMDTYKSFTEANTPKGTKP